MHELRFAKYKIQSKASASTYLIYRQTLLLATSYLVIIELLVRASLLNIDRASISSTELICISVERSEIIEYTVIILSMLRSQRFGGSKIS